MIDEVFGTSGLLSKKFVGYAPRKGQVDMALAVEAAIAGKKHLVVEGPTGCHAAGQEIMLASGRIVKVEDVRRGDCLMGPDGRPREVRALARGEEEMVDVVPVKGASWRVNEGHVLTLVRTDTGRVVDVSIREYRGWSATQKRLYKLFRAPIERFSAEVPAAELSLSPYFVGIMLGDGGLASESVIITKPDLEIRAALESEAAKFPGLRVTSDGLRHALVGGKNRFARNAVLDALRDLGISPIRSEDRFVPEEYKLSEWSVRSELLAGLIDTDGSFDSGGFDFLSKSSRLANDVAFLARSIGLAAYVKPRTCTGFGVSGTYFRVFISGDCSIVPCRISRKKASPREQKKDVLRTGFELVSSGTREPYFGFSLSGDGRFLLGDFTVTHNTGKSLAYLVPSIAHAAIPASKDSRQQSRVIVVTANIALQEQLVDKDLPLLAEVLPFQFSFALAKGKNNYLCADALSKTLAQGILEKKDPLFDRLMAWAQSTTSGDVSEFPETPPAALWKSLSTTSEECKGTSCKYFKQCFAEKAKREVQNAQVVVTNYHLFFAHLLVREKMRAIQEAGGDVALDVVLPPADVIVFDEAHKAADIARDFLGFQLSKGQVEWLVRGFNHELAQETRLAAEAFFAATLAHKKSRAYRSRLKSGHPIDGERLATLLDRVAKFYRDSIAAAAWDPEERAELEMRSRRGTTLASQVRQAMKPGATPDIVYFVEENERGGCAIKSKPIDVAPWLREELFGQFGTVVLTSATLATGSGSSGSFSFVKKEVGLEASGELVAESPFAFENNVLLVVPRTMCMPDDREKFPEYVAEHVARVADAADGRTLGLFTSYRNLEASYRRLGGFRHRVLRQGDAPRMRLVNQFKEETSSVLLGVESFWAGVDAPGQTLSCVVIDRLPFPTPDDPIVDAISERDDRWFFNYAVPRALIQLKQGFGRLIRTTSDYGVVVVLDRRLVEKGYGRQFLAALPRVRMSDEVADVKKFLEEHR